jgi:hypothetical protein
MERVRSVFAEPGDHRNISFRVKSATLPHSNRPFHFPGFWVVGALNDREILIA